MHPYNEQQRKDAAIRYRKLKKLRDAGLTLAQIGNIEKCSRERIRQILERGDANSA